MPVTSTVLPVAAEAPALFGTVIIGDEILSGRRSDQHLAQVIQMLKARGLHLAWARYAGDDATQLAALFRETFASASIVFSFGGIGVTPDDHTRQAVAAALNVPLNLHPDAAQAIRARMAETGQPLTPQRLQLGYFPAESRIIPNPYNRIPGFSVANHHFFPGFPEMAWPMAAWVLDHYYAHLFHSHLQAEAAVRVWAGHEGNLLGLMQDLEAAFPTVKIFSLPHLGSAQWPAHVELGVKGDAAAVPEAFACMTAALQAAGLDFSQVEMAASADQIVPNPPVPR